MTNELNRSIVSKLQKRSTKEEDELYDLPIFSDDYCKGETDLKYVKTFLRELQRLHQADRDNENARKESLSLSINAKDHYPKSLRTSLRDTNEFYVKAMIPIMRETYRCHYDPQDSFKPCYNKISEQELSEELVFGVLTSSSVGHIPPVTICIQD